MEKCKTCKKESENYMFKCPNCGATVCPSCAKSTKNICPYCYYTLDYLI